jgi:threonine dehydrogenase-like Zn-dependent dehydrogenase
MRALCWNDKYDVTVETVPDPKIEHPRDAIVRITSTAICGSDLHLYNDLIKTMKRGDVLGHKPIGEVVELGSHVTNLKFIEEEKIDPSFIVTHELTLDAAPQGYETFKHRRDGCIKIVLKPWEKETAGKVQLFTPERKARKIHVPHG